MKNRKLFYGRFFIFIIIMAGLIVSRHAPAQMQENPTMPYPVEVIADIRYNADAPNESPRHTLDLYRPIGPTDYPVLLYVHGGAWVSGSKADAAAVGNTLAANGIGVVAINYRLSPEVTHPAHMQDVARAFAWTIENIAGWGGDPEKIFIGGHSAGGHLTTLLALDDRYLADIGQWSDKILGIISFSGVYVIEDWIMDYADGAFPDDQLGRYAASPYVHVHAGAPPMLLLVARNDYPQLIGEAKLMTRALENVEVPVELHTIPNRDHYSLISLFGNDNDTALGVVMTWIENRLNQSSSSEL